MERDYFDEERYARAQKRIKEIKGFYWHLFWYMAVNLFASFGEPIIRMFVGDEVNFHIGFGNFAVWFFWGIGLASHWIKVFGKDVFFSKDWEERKIKEFMDKDKFE